MKVFVAGASGAIGKHLIPLLVARNYEVTAMTRSPKKAEILQALGAEPVVVDGLDRDAVVQAVVRARKASVARRHLLLHGLLVPLAHLLMRHRTVHYELMPDPD